MDEPHGEQELPNCATSDCATSDCAKVLINEAKHGSATAKQGHHTTEGQLGFLKLTAEFIEPHTNIHQTICDYHNTSEILLEHNSALHQQTIHSSKPTKFVNLARPRRKRFRKLHQPDVSPEKRNSSSAEEISTSTTESDVCEFRQDYSFNAIHVPLSCEILTTAYCVQVTDRYDAPSPIEQRSLTSDNVRMEADYNSESHSKLSESHLNFMPDKMHKNFLRKKDKMREEKVAVKKEHEDGEHSAKQGKESSKKRLELKGISKDRGRSSNTTDEEGQRENDMKTKKIKEGSKTRWVWVNRKPKKILRRRQKTKERVYEEKQTKSEKEREKQDASESERKKEDEKEKHRKGINCFKREGKNTVEKVRSKKDQCAEKIKEGGIKNKERVSKSEKNVKKEEGEAKKQNGSSGVKKKTREANEKGDERAKERKEHHKKSPSAEPQGIEGQPEKSTRKAGERAEEIEGNESAEVVMESADDSVPSKKSAFDFCYGGGGKKDASKKARKTKKGKKAKVGVDVGADVSTGVDVQVPDVAVDVRGGSGRKTGSWRFPKISFPKAKQGGGDVKGGVHVSLPSGEMKISGPKVDIQAVECDLDVPTAEVSVPDVSFGVDVQEQPRESGLASVSVGGDVNIPGVAVTADVSAPDVGAGVSVSGLGDRHAVELDLPKVQVDASAPSIDVSVPAMHVPSVGVEVGQVGGADVTVKARKPGFKWGRKGHKATAKAGTAAASVAAPEVGLDAGVSVPVVDVGVSGDVGLPSVDVSVPSKKSAFDFCYGGGGKKDASKKARKTKKGKKAKVGVDVGADVSTGVDVQVPDVAVDVRGGSGRKTGSWRFPKISFPKAKQGGGDVKGGVHVSLPSGEMKISGPKVDIQAVECDLDVPTAEVSVPDVSFGVDVQEQPRESGLASVSVGGDVNIPGVAVTADVSAPDVGAGVSVSGLGDRHAVELDLPKVQVDASAPSIDVSVPAMHVPSVGVEVGQVGGADFSVNSRKPEFSRIFKGPKPCALADSQSTALVSPGFRLDSTLPSPSDLPLSTPAADIPGSEVVEPPVFASVHLSPFSSLPPSSPATFPSSLPPGVIDFASMRFDSPSVSLHSSSGSVASVVEPFVTPLVSESALSSSSHNPHLEASPAKVCAPLSSLFSGSATCDKPGNSVSLSISPSSPSFNFNAEHPPPSDMLNSSLLENSVELPHNVDVGLRNPGFSSVSAELPSAVLIGDPSGMLQSSYLFRMDHGMDNSDANYAVSTLDVISDSSKCESLLLNSHNGEQEVEVGKLAEDAIANSSKLRWLGSLGRKPRGSPEKAKHVGSASPQTRPSCFKPGDVESEGAEVAGTLGKTKVKKLKKHRKLKKPDASSPPVASASSTTTSVVQRTPTGICRDLSIRQTWHGIAYDQPFDNGLELDSDGAPKPPSTPTGIKITPVLCDSVNYWDLRRRGIHDSPRPRPWSALEIAPPGCNFVDDDYLFPDALTPTKFPSFRGSKDAFYDVPYMDDKALPIEEPEWPLGESKRNLLSKSQEKDIVGRIVAQEECSIISLDDKENQLDSDRSTSRSGRFHARRRNKKDGKGAKGNRSSSGSKVSGRFSAWLHRQGEHNR